MTYEDIIEVLETRLVTGKPKKGGYRGSPGKEVYFILPDLSDEQFDTLALKIAEMFKRKKVKRLPRDHIKWGNFIRYIYGCFHKDGCLQSEERLNEIKNQNPEWVLEIRFMKRVAYYFEQVDERYGLMLHYEMLGHRLGDRAIIKHDESVLLEMEQCYIDARKIAREIKSPKHMFSPVFWCGRYFYLFGDEIKAQKYYRKTIKYMNKHCPDSKVGYQNKLITVLTDMKKMSNKKEWSRITKAVCSSKNSCFKRAKKRFKFRGKN